MRCPGPPWKVPWPGGCGERGPKPPTSPACPQKRWRSPAGAGWSFSPDFPIGLTAALGQMSRGAGRFPRFPRLPTHLPRCVMPGSPHQLRGIYLCFQPRPQHQGKQEWQVSRDVKGQHQNQGDGRQQPHSFFSELVPQHFSQPCVGARTPQGDQGDLEDMGGLVLNFSGSQRSSAQRSS